MEPREDRHLAMSHGGLYTNAGHLGMLLRSALKRPFPTKLLGILK